METDATAYRWERYFFPYNSHRLTGLTFGNETNITRYINAGGTGFATRCHEYAITGCPNLNGALGTTLGTGQTTAAPLLIPDELGAAYAARKDKPFFRILRSNRLAQKILKSD
jgi:hypothetical protein